MNPAAERSGTSPLAELFELNVIEILERYLPQEARGGQVSAVELSGGLSNRSFRVQVGTATYLIKLLAPPGPLGVDRRAERVNAGIAADLGLGPHLLHDETQREPAGPELLIQTWVPGEPLTAADLAVPQVLETLAATCRTLHGGPRFANTIDMFDVHASYLRTCDELSLQLPDGYRQFLPALAAMRSALDSHKPSRVACHNDLRPNNVIGHDGTICLIDFEYSGNNDPFFDLGNLAAEADLTADQLAHLIRHYRGRPVPADLARATLFRLLAEYGWILWAMVWESTHAPKSLDQRWVSLAQSTRERGGQLFERAASQLSTPGFRSLLTAAAGR